MTWRRFQVLLRGLSPHSATVARLSAGYTFGKKRQTVHEVTSPAAAQSAFEMIFKPPPARR